MATILYVEDEPALQRAVRAWLTRRGHVVYVAASVTEAREILDETALDGVLLDVWLGGESGFEVQGWIDENRPELYARVAFVTGDPIGQMEHATFSGRLDHPVLGKPFDLELLDGLVRSWER